MICSFPDVIMNKNSLTAKIIIVTALWNHKRCLSVAETSSNIGKDKSFVYDLNKEHGTVSMRVVFVLRSTEVNPFVLEICSTFFYKSSCIGEAAAWLGAALARPSLGLACEHGRPTIDPLVFRNFQLVEVEVSTKLPQG